MPTREWSEKIEDKIVDFTNEIPSRMELKESFCTHTKRVESERVSRLQSTWSRSNYVAHYRILLKLGNCYIKSLNFKELLSLSQHSKAQLG